MAAAQEATPEALQEAVLDAAVQESVQRADETPVLDQRVLLRSAANFRDLGGLPVAGGTVARGQVYRSATLSRLNDEDLPSFEKLGIATVYDLRTDSERTQDPDRLPLNTRSIGLDVLADGTAGVAQAVSRMRDDPKVVNELLQGGKVEQMLQTSYREFIDLPSAQRSYRSFFLDLADEGREGAALFHCTAGKDRTGWAAASLLMLLGSDEATIRADYLQTNTDFLPTLEPLLKSAAPKGVDPELLREVFSVKDSYLDAAMEQLETSFGNVENYFATGLGLNPTAIDALKTRFIA